MGQVINYKKKGTVKCYLTGIERKETPEEMVRQSWLQRLVEEYSYPRDQIEVEYSIKMGNARVRVDIAIFYPNKPYNQENIMIIIEVKREDIKPTDKEEGIKQLESYLAACPNSKFGLWVGQEKQAYEVIEKDGLRRLEMISDIPLSGDLDLDKFSFDKLVQPIEGLRATFKRCHNHIYI